MQTESQPFVKENTSAFACARRQRCLWLMAFALVVALAAVLPSAHAQTFSVLYTFTDGTDGGQPASSLARDKAGNLYGTTTAGGDFTTCDFTYGCGVVFKLDPSGKETVLYTFTGMNGNFGPDGEYPNGLALDTAGNLYGTAVYGGDLNCAGEAPGQGCGTVFKIDSTGKFTLLHQFTADPDGATPNAPVIRDSKGNLYGTTSFGGQGGNPGNGTVFKVDATGKESVLYRFQGGADGTGPSGLVRDPAGSLYGSTSGTIFKVDSSGKHTVLYTDRENDGGPSELFRDTAGNLYGTTVAGGSPALGTVFELTSANKYKVVYTFTDSNDGYGPYGGVIRDTAGNLYGTTIAGGTFNYGTVFKLDSKGKKTILYAFTGGTDGAIPVGRLIRDSADNLYGTTTLGGDPNVNCSKGPLLGCGTVFKITP